ncbi:T9SS type A sorting domain-containing protein [Hymenobacter volaticus]|uniref:T9SS type A sorting domain-containing protein n=2 Tax=Hymenobacter volaticus TaxID=2932254 RepID=A0ABY4G4K8_9BACT|nr:T9SS type A sorting domain-containing protein [Hymenobacter volaticus]
MQDTLDLRIHHQLSSGINFLTDAVSGDTLQRVWVTRHQGLYYFTCPISDTCYWVHAARIKRNQVQGLADAYRQLHLMEQAARAGQFPDLVQYHDSTTGILRLRFDPKRLRKFYTAMLDSLPIYRMVPRTPYQYASLLTDSVATTAQNSEPFIHSMYPNPASDVLNVGVASNELCEATIFDMEGKLIQTAPVSAGATTAQVQYLPAGRYMVRVRETATSQVPPNNCKLNVKH